MSHGIAIRSDIEEELAAIQRGECGACRIGGTHPYRAACDNTPAEHQPPGNITCSCGTRYNPARLAGRYAGNGCPDCLDRKEAGMKSHHVGGKMLNIILAAIMLTVPLQRPHITIAQGLVESGLNTQAVGKAKEKGAYQVMERHWGKVPKDHNGQALQNQRIMDELLQATGHIDGALEFYNGGESNKQTRKYRRKVMATALELALLSEIELQDGAAAIARGL